MLVWMDLEMTGLDPSQHRIVEIATIITEDNLDQVAEGPDLVIATSDDALSRMDDFVTDMHTKSGLLEQIKSSTVSMEDAENQTLEFIKSHIPEPRSTLLCGNTISTDRWFIQAQMPRINDHLHYRNIDVSTLKELFRRWRPEDFKKTPLKKSGHRAMDDIRESINELRYYQKLIAPNVK